MVLFCTSEWQFSREKLFSYSLLSLKDLNLAGLKWDYHGFSCFTVFINLNFFDLVSILSSTMDIWPYLEIMYNVVGQILIACYVELLAF